jgi:hypothetical protein
VFAIPALLALVPRPAAADVTVIGHYTLINGDTLTRASYFSAHRVRITAPDGREFAYDSKADSVVIIDHKHHIYWIGTMAHADSVATQLLAAQNRGVAAKIEANRDRWDDIVKSFNDSLNVEKTRDTRSIAGYPCTRWMMYAGHYMTHERWVARSLDVAYFGQDLEKIICATISDPVGRVLMRQLIALGTHDGLALASRTEFHTLTQQGEYSWQATAVKSGPIPASTFRPPAGYRRIVR